MRAINPEIEAHLSDGSMSGALDDVFAGLDALGMTRWRINEDILKHVIHAWNSGKPIAGLPEEIPPVFSSPPKPNNYEEDEQARRQYFKLLKEERQNYYDKKSMRCTENYKIEIARAVRVLARYLV
jgi:DNA-directed RNA polymerase